MRFHFVDRIDAVQKFTSARGVKTVSFEEGFLDGLHGEAGSFPRTLLIECAAQLVSWLVLYSTDFTRIPLIATIEEAVIHSSVPCGTAVTVEVEVRSWNTEGALVNCRLRTGERVIAEGVRCVCTFIDSTTLVDAEEMRMRFHELSRTADVT